MKNKKYLVNAVWYRKASGSCRSYKGKKATPISWEFDNLEEATKWANNLKECDINPYRQYEEIEIIEN